MKKKAKSRAASALFTQLLNRFGSCCLLFTLIASAVGCCCSAAPSIDAAIFLKK